MLARTHGNQDARAAFLDFKVCLRFCPTSTTGRQRHLAKRRRLAPSRLLRSFNQITTKAALGRLLPKNISSKQTLPRMSAFGERHRPLSTQSSRTRGPRAAVLSIAMHRSNSALVPQRWPVRGLDAHRGVHCESAAACPTFHRSRAGQLWSRGVPCRRIDIEVVPRRDQVMSVF